MPFPWRSLLTPPSFPEDDDKAIAATMVHYGILFGFASILFYVPVLIVAGDPLWRILVVEATLLSALTLHAVLLRRGHVYGVARAFILFGWLSLALVNYTAGGVRAPGFSTHVLFILSIGAMLGGRAVFLMASASTLLGAVFLVLEARGLLPASEVANTPLRYWVIFSANFFIAALILRTLVRRLHASLAAARKELAIRLEAEGELERHQLYLEDLVRERTNDLEKANTSLTQEIGERRRVEEALRLDRDLLGNLMETSPIGILVIDAGSRFTFANAAAERILGVPKEEILRRRCDDPAWAFTDHAGRAVAAGDLPFLRTLASGEPTRDWPLAVACPDGRTVLLSVNAAPLATANGGRSGVVATVEDVTDRQRLEQEILKTQKLESVGVLAGGIAHDFNNILTAILGNISLARFELPLKGNVAEPLEKAEKAAMHARDLTQQLLTFSRGGAPVKQTVPLGELIARVTQFALRGANVRAEIDVPADLWSIDADPGQIGQVLQNLVINAGQAMPGGGVVHLAAANVLPEDAPGGSLPAGRYVRVTVTDTGVGIPPENLTKIFDPYFTTKKGGSGLGLAVTYAIVRNHGGQIAVSSNPGAGTTFTLHLPATSAPLPSTTPEEEMHFGGGRVLLMDDEAMVREIAGKLLTALGYRPTVCSNGEEALAAYREATAGGAPFDVVILDLTVPGGMGGREALERLKVFDPAVKGIVSSGYSNDPIMARHEEHGFRGVLTKPYQSSDLSRVLRQVLRS